MKHGNGTFRGWVLLCVLLLAILPALSRADVAIGWDQGGLHYSTAGDGPYRSYGTMVGSGNAITWVTGSNPVHVRFTFADGSKAAYYATYTNSELSLVGKPVGMIAVKFSMRMFEDISDYSNQYWPYVNPEWDGVSVYWNGTTVSAQNNHTLTVNLAVVNNLNRTETLTVGTAATQTLNGLTSTTKTFVVTGAAGTVATMGASPDTLVLEQNYDPLVIGATDSTVERAGHIGSPPVTKQIQIVTVNYVMSLIGVVVKMDGAQVGTAWASPSADGMFPCTTNMFKNLTMSADSVLTFQMPSGVIGSVRVDHVGELTNYVLTISNGGNDEASTTISAPSSDGTYTAVSTGSTGTTTITHTTAGTGTNTDTTPGGVFGGTSTGSSGTTGTYGNTTPNGSSAANQDAANSLAGIERNTKISADNSTAVRQDYESNLSSDNKAGVKNFLSSWSDVSGKSQTVMNGMQGSAGSLRDATSGAVSSKVGNASTSSLDTPTEPSPGTVELHVGPGKTITMQLNPFAADGPLGGLVRRAAAFIKRLIAYGLIIMFLREVMKEVRGVCGAAFLTGGYTSQTVTMIQSANIFGWSVGVPVAALARIALIALAVALLLALPPAALAAMEAGLPWSDLVMVYHAGPPGAGGDASLVTALGYVDYVLPWRLMLSLPLYYIVIQNILFPLQMFWQFVFKFLP